jgi:hypothetical protein
MKKTNDLIGTIKTRAYTPGSAASFGDNYLLDLLNREIQDYIVPRIKMLNKEFNIVTDVIDVAAGQTRIKIPRRSLNSSIRDLQVTDGINGISKMDMIKREDVQFFQGRVRVGHYPQKYYLESNDVVLLPAPEMPVQVMMSYYQRPNTLVSQSLERTVLGVNKTTGLITLNSFAEFLKTGDRVDFVDGLYTTDTNARDLLVTAVDVLNNTVTVSGDVSSVEQGDLMYKAGTTCVAQIPDEMESLLIARVCLRMAETQNDESAINIARAAIGEMESGFQLLISQRVVGDSPRIITRTNLW